MSEQPESAAPDEKERASIIEDPETLYKDEELRGAFINSEKELIKENEQLYREIRTDFNPFIYCLIGFVAAGLLATIAERILNIGIDLIYSSIFGLFLGFFYYLKKRKEHINHRDTEDTEL